MSAHSFMEVNGRLFLACRETYIPDLVALFTEAELRLDGEKFGYHSTVCEMRDRLQLHGFTSVQALAELDDAVRRWHARHPNPGADALGVPVRGSGEILDELRAYLNRVEKWASYDEPEEVFSQLDTRTILRLALDVADDDSGPVRYNLDDLVSYRLLKPGVPITDQAREDHKRTIATNAPLVILTEGSSDSQLLTAAIQVTHPHLVGFMRFMDFGGGAEGGAASLGKLVRSFAGAGIANRVLAVADNDTAAHDALKSLKGNKLPGNYRLMHYPDLPLLRRYPTLGPQLTDPVLMDVNGRAGSLEMYLGRELLTRDGELVPVQWTGYVEGQQSYQGAISAPAKKRIQEAFRKKAVAAQRSPHVRKEQDWSGLEAIVSGILNAFDHGEPIGAPR